MTSLYIVTGLNSKKQAIASFYFLIEKQALSFCQEANEQNQTEVTKISMLYGTEAAELHLAIWHIEETFLQQTEVTK
tara:strand:+ start:2869 stop:3099 length:231 start_codon:yes stop_codon:yes gene_type:complete